MSLLLPEDSIAVITIRQEAEGEPYQAKVAVGEEIRNRTAQKFFSDGTIIGTCLWPLQYSGWNAKSPNRLRCVQSDDTDANVQECIRAWQESATTNVAQGAVNHYAAYIPAPDWVNDFVYVGMIGHQRFYRRP